jgi:hypothetical protein
MQVEAQPNTLLTGETVGVLPFRLSSASGRVQRQARRPPGPVQRRAELRFMDPEEAAREIGRESEESIEKVRGRLFVSYWSLGSTRAARTQLRMQLGGRETGCGPLDDERFDQRLPGHLEFVETHVIRPHLTELRALTNTPVHELPDPDLLQLLARLASRMHERGVEEQPSTYGMPPRATPEPGSVEHYYELHDDLHERLRVDGQSDEKEDEPSRGLCERRPVSDAMSSDRECEEMEVDVEDTLSDAAPSESGGEQAEGQPIEFRTDDAPNEVASIKSGGGPAAGPPTHESPTACAPPDARSTETCPSSDETRHHLPAVWFVTRISSPVPRLRRTGPSSRPSRRWLKCYARRRKGYQRAPPLRQRRRRIPIARLGWPGARFGASYPL